jgi:drug/metabolite transporter (DMT)-like permease
MAALLALAAALAYGTSDFAAGLASRRYSAGPVTGGVQVLTLMTAAGAVLLLGPSSPSAATLAWGTLSGLGTAVGTLSLYQGLAVARVSVVATLSAVLAAVVPVIVGVALGDHLSLAAQVGLALALPAIALMSWQADVDTRRAARAGILYGVLAGLGFALLFVALDQAGTGAGAWPLIPGQSLALVLIAPFAYRGLGAARPPASAVKLTLSAGILSGMANLLFLAAIDRGQLSIVAVLTSLYPAATVVLARVFLDERWSALQSAGLLVSVAAIVLISAG